MQTTDEILTEQYKLYVEMADRISSRRLQIHAFYIPILTGLLVILSIVVEKPDYSAFQKIIFLMVSVLGVFFCLLWFLQIKSFKSLNKTKFEVIHEIEVNLPFQPYKIEQEKILNTKRYFGTTQVELALPIVISIPYIYLLLFALSKFVSINITFM